MKDSIAVLIGLGLALVAGIIVAATGNGTLLRGVDFIAPFGTLWVNAIRMTVIPLVVSLLITGMASTTEVRAIGRMGRRTILVFLSLLAGVALVAVPAVTFVFGLLPHDAAHRPSLPAGAVEAATQLAPAAGGQTIAAWLTSLIPPNPIAAAASGAMLPLIVFTILLALAIAGSPTAARERLVGLFQALRDAMLVLVGWVVALAPVGVFALVLPLAARGGLGLAGGVGFYIVAYSIGCLAVSLLLYPVVAVVTRTPIRHVAKAALPVQLIALSTSSSIASLPALIDSAREELGLDDRVTGFVLPLAVSTFHIAGAVSWTSSALFIAWFYGIDLHAAQLATIALTTVTFAFAVPGIPRGAFIMLTPLFLSIGLPPRASAS